MRLPRKLLRFLVITLVAVVVLDLAAAWYFRFPPQRVPRLFARVVITPVLAWWYAEDKAEADGLRAPYWVGPGATDPAPSWRGLQERFPALDGVEVRCAPPPRFEVPFVHESDEADYIRGFRQRNELRRFLDGKRSEYEAMLALARWVGTRFDHGTDRPFNRSSIVFDPQRIVDAGARGERFWCEVAARTMAHAATAVGWSSRVAGMSTTGYYPEHAAAEVWSNQFDKWILIDADFNIVYESDGTPLSAYEVCHDGPRLTREGKLDVRRFAAVKKSLNDMDMVPYYNFVSIDLRTDWRSRRLRAGSPEGGDHATWWTARKDAGPLLTARPRIDDARVFDWPVNHVQIVAVGAEADQEGAGYSLDLELGAYSPRFRAFEVQLDGGEWTRRDGRFTWSGLESGAHTIRARVRARSGFAGPESAVSFRLR